MYYCLLLSCYISVTCQYFPIEHGNVTFNGIPSYPGDSAAIVCDNDFELHGAEILTCSSNGTWSDLTPTCKEKSEFIIM